MSSSEGPERRTDLPQPEGRGPLPTEEEGRRTILIAAMIVSIVALGYVAVLLVGGQALRGLPGARQIQEAGRAIGEVIGGNGGPVVQLPPLQSSQQAAAQASPTPIVPRATTSPSVIPPDPDEPSLVTFTIEYENTTGTRLTGVKITNDIPSGSSYRQGSATPTAEFNKDTLIWNLGTLDAGQKGSVSFQVSTNKKGRITNRAVMTSNEAPAAEIESSATVG